jgi:ribulose-bisphosphate carboxylase large chain
MPEKFDFETYHEYIDRTFKPDPDDHVIAVFRIKPAQGFTIDDAAGGVVAESSTGTWTTIHNWYDRERVRMLSGRSCEFLDLKDGSWIVKIACPVELLRKGIFQDCWRALREMFSG